MKVRRNENPVKIIEILKTIINPKKTLPKERIQTHSTYFQRLTYYSSLDLKIEFFKLDFTFRESPKRRGRVGARVL